MHLTNSRRDGGPYDALLIVGFGGPERPEDVMPFLENVTRGRNVPRERLLEVAEHYHKLGGVSPINQQVRDLIAGLRPELDRRGIALPIYWGNRNWHPMLADTMRAMSTDGVRNALAIALAAYSSYSSCRQYIENIEQARAEVGTDAPAVAKVRPFFNHPDFIAANADRVRAALEAFPIALRGQVQIAFTAHSIPLSMARSCDYEAQLTECGRLVAEAVGVPPDRWRVVYQSRSGRPEDPWLEPDILEYLDMIEKQSGRAVLVHPIGFLSDHLEVLYDLDDAARKHAESLGLAMVRSATVGTHPRFVAMIGALIAERLSDSSERLAVGCFGPRPDSCHADCCPAPRRPARA